MLTDEIKELTKKVSTVWYISITILSTFRMLNNFLLSQNYFRILNANVKCNWFSYKLAFEFKITTIFCLKRKVKFVCLTRKVNKIYLHIIYVLISSFFQIRITSSSFAEESNSPWEPRIVKKSTKDSSRKRRTTQESNIKTLYSLQVLVCNFILWIKIS